MKTEFQPSFIKDLKKLRGTPHFEKINSLVFEEIPLVESVDDLSNCKKLVGFDAFFRIRVGDFRIGFRIEEDVLIFMRVVHRKDIYRFFP